MPIREYTWNPLTDSVIEETDGAGNVLVTYTNEPAPYGPLISECRDGQSRQYHFDALGSTRALTDESGQVTDTFTYDAWGNEVAHAGESDTPFIWAGQLGYSSANPLPLVVVRYRIYRGTTGSWVSNDRDEYVEDGWGYLYARNSPTRLSDPSGSIVSPRLAESWRSSHGQIREKTNALVVVHPGISRVPTCQEKANA